MTPQIEGETVFCDDIRHEVNGKVSLIGCYASILNFSGPAPSILPTFGAYVQMTIPAGMAVEVVEIAAILAYSTESHELMKLNYEMSKEETEAAKYDNNEPDAVSRIIAPFHWTMLEIKEDCIIRIRARINHKDIVKLGALVVKFPTSL